MAQIPIDVNEVANLTALGVNPANINFKCVTMESDKYVCIREDAPQGASLTVVDLANGNEVSRMPMAAESTIMNPEKKIVALRKGPALQVFDLESKSKVCSFKLPDNSVVVFWSWIDAKTIAIVTQTSEIGRAHV